MKKIIIILGIIILVIVILNNVINQSNPEPDILPEAGYCIYNNLSVEYGTYEIDGEKKPYEYCPINTFCQNYDYVLFNYEMNQDSIDEFENFKFDQENKGYSCFEDYGIYSKDSGLKVKFICCNQKPIESEGCEGNICDGKFTGKIDENGCRIFGKYNIQENKFIRACGGLFNY